MKSKKFSSFFESTFSEFGLDFFLLNSSPELFLDEEMALMKQRILTLDQQLKMIKKELSQKNLDPLTEERLKIYERGIQDNLLTFTSLAEKFLDLIESYDYQLSETYQETQKLDFYPMALRDWTYGESELNQYLSSLRPGFNQMNTLFNINESSFLSLGSGACGLEDMLLKEFPFKDPFLMDHSFGALFFYQSLRNGFQGNLGSFVLSPSRVKESFYSSSLRRVYTESSTSLICGDFSDLGVKREGVDCVFTPWFFDVTNAELRQTLSKIHFMLKSQGCLFFTGPFGKQGSKFQDLTCLEEFKQLIKNEEFEIIWEETTEVPYRHLPGAGRKINEVVTHLLCQKC